MTLLHAEITERILKCFFSLNGAAPYGLPADFYRNALAVEFEQNGLKAVRNQPVAVKHRGAEIGELVADFLVENSVLVRVISKNAADDQAVEEAKMLLRFSEFEVCLILNASGDHDFKRLILSNELKR